jgi:hypothetical protein
MIGFDLYNKELAAAGEFFPNLCSYSCGKVSVDNKGKWSRVRRWS